MSELKAIQPFGTSFKGSVAPKGSGYVMLNVGGSLFCTTVSTLKKQGNHMLSAMFSGRMEVPFDADGWVTIDRDGRLFDYVLNFLRDGVVTLPETYLDRQALLAEARFYLIDGLIKLIEDRDRPTVFAPLCVVPTLRSDDEHRSLVESTYQGIPAVVFAYNRSNNKFSYTSPSDDALLKNIEMFDKISSKFNGRVMYAKDIRGEGGHICTWFFYGQGKQVAEVCCTSMVYSGERKHIKIEFPEARLYEENMNVLLFERGSQHDAAPSPVAAAFSQRYLPHPDWADYHID